MIAGHMKYLFTSSDPKVISEENVNANYVEFGGSWRPSFPKRFVTNLSGNQQL